MNFRGTGRPLRADGLQRVCDTLGVREAEVWAVLSVETTGFGYFADRRPKILFERHIFHRRTNGAHDAIAPDVSSPHAGGYTFGSAEYDRLEKAMRLDETAALESASWGIGQVMGFNHRVAGYDTVLAMVEGMVKDEDTQLLAMAGYINETRLSAALRRHDWTSFARRYNGKDFEKNQYDTRLSGAYARARRILPDIDLRTAQVALTYLGINPGPVDGMNGRKTRSALALFQERSGLPVSEALDAETKQALLKTAFPVT